MSISKELLSEVYREHLDNNDTKEVLWVQEGTIPHQIAYGLETGAHYTNIHTLAHECKEWAYKGKVKYRISSIRHNKDIWKAHIYINKPKSKNMGVVIREHTEPEAIFKACEWILENK